MTEEKYLTESKPTIKASALFENYETSMYKRAMESPRIEYEFQELGVAMSKEHGKKVWSLFYKYPLDKIRTAWTAYQKQPIKTYPYFIGILKKTK